GGDQLELLPGERVAVQIRMGDPRDLVERVLRHLEAGVGVDVEELVRLRALARDDPLGPQQDVGPYAHGTPSRSPREALGCTEMFASLTRHPARVDPERYRDLDFTTWRTAVDISSSALNRALIRPRYSSPVLGRSCGARRRERVHRARELDVLARDPGGVVRGEVDADGAVDVEPFGVVVHPLGHQRGAGHEGEGGHEVGEPELAEQLVALAAPAGEALERGRDLGIGEARRHGCTVSHRVAGRGNMGARSSVVLPMACGTCGGSMPAASLDQVYVTCPACGHVAVAGLAPEVRRGAEQVSGGYAWVAGSLLLVGIALAVILAM